MSSTTLQIRLDSDLRREADDLFTAAGLDLPSAVRLFLRQSVIRRRLPFEVVGADPFHSEANQRALADSIDSIERGEARPHSPRKPMNPA
ncbi:MAG: type II toxin-antitoxin system RelB/DinJ family antitoxin [Kiritimatiellae bacterium]|nr:type II toxin-antitoxin system RelB/DinJ family antitoxin [Kiritimatiellia bacterium]